jgi:hypothetical protein
VSRHKKTVRARIALGSVDAGAVLVEVQIDLDGAGGTLEEGKVVGDAGKGLWVRSRGGRDEDWKEGDEGDDGEGLHGVDG